MSQRTDILAVVTLGPLTFYIHKPLDQPDGYVATEFTTRAVAIYADELGLVIRTLREKLEYMNVYKFFEDLERLELHEKQSSLRACLLSRTEEKVEDSA